MGYSTQMLMAVVIVEVILISLAPAVINMTDTRDCGTVVSASFNVTDCPLENASAMSKIIYSLVPLFYAILAIVPIVTVLKFKK